LPDFSARNICKSSYGKPGVRQVSVWDRGRLKKNTRSMEGGHQRILKPQGELYVTMPVRTSAKIAEVLDPKRLRKGMNRQETN
jgi:hypothetical protein